MRTSSNIDIFPVDNAPDSDKELRKRSKYFDRMNFIYQYRFQKHSKLASVKMRIFQFIISFLPPLDEKKFKEKYDKKIQEYNNIKTDNVVYFSNRKYMKKVISRKVFDDVVMLPFENSEFPAPIGWKEVLEGLYGKYYMQLPPESQRVTAHGCVIIDLENSWKNTKGVRMTMKKYKLGYTTGVFDLFHIGHLNLLRNAKAQCEYLIVGVSTDDVVRSYKNKFPIIPFEERILLLLGQ